MKTIKVFLASSDELSDERQKFGNLIRQLGDIFVQRGIYVKLLVWEDMDPSYNNCRKQDEYNKWIRESQFFVALFRTRAGQYTREEWDVAQAANSSRQEPKLLIYCQTLQPGEVEEQELTDFKQMLEQRLGHFWDNYATTDKLHHDFTMYFMRTTIGSLDAIKVEDGQVTLEGRKIADMDNLPYAAGNEWYNETRQRLAHLADEVAQLWEAIQKAPEMEVLRTMRQQKLDEYNALKEQFARHQQSLLDTAKRVAEMQLEKVSAEMRRAVEAFEQGHLEAANAILDGIEREAERHVEQMDRDRELVHQDIEALLLKAKTLMADERLPLTERVQKTLATYRKADEWAAKSALPQEKHVTLLDGYGFFLYKYAFYDDALAVFTRLATMQLLLHGEEHPDTANSYNNIGYVYGAKGDYDRAFEYILKALAIREKVLGEEHPDTASSYNNIGVVYNAKGDYDRELEYYLKALAIREKVLGEKHPDTATSYNNIGNVYSSKGDYGRALEYHHKALAIREKVFGEENPYTARSYNNIGYVYGAKGDYDRALEYYLKALARYEKVFGEENPYTARSYNNIGVVYDDKGDYDRALEYYLKALAIREKVFGEENPYTARSYNNIGDVYDEKNDYAQALEYYYKALAIYEKVLGEEHPSTLVVKENISLIMQRQSGNE